MIADWRAHQKNNFSNWEKLSAFLELNEEQKARIAKSPRFSLNLPRRLADKIQKGTLDDPILKQFLPTVEEEAQSLRFVADPTADQSFRKSAKLLQKYDGRALLVTTSACVMHCRFCFRQNFPYETERKSFTEELQLIEKDASIKEIILSGGDPLSLSNAILNDLLVKLAAIPHIKRIRFHSRFPIGIPERIDSEFLNMIAASPKQIFFVLHCNHYRELDEDIFAHLKRLQQAGAVLLNQAVLLKGVNDQPEILQTLSESLVDHGVLPYYLHQLDPVRGTEHFEVKEEEGVGLIKKLTANLSGYAVPKYVREIPNERSKTGLLSLHSLNRVDP